MAWFTSINKDDVCGSCKHPAKNHSGLTGRCPKQVPVNSSHDWIDGSCFMKVNISTMKQVRCIDPDPSISEFLTVGKVYEVQSETDTSYVVSDDRSIVSGFYKYRFEVVGELGEDVIPLAVAAPKKKPYNPDAECACGIGLKNAQCTYHKE
jgi:hypothetical protein